LRLNYNSIFQVDLYSVRRLAICVGLWALGLVTCSCESGSFHTADYEWYVYKPQHTNTAAEIEILL